MPPKRKNQKKSDLVTDEAENDVEVEASVDMPATTSLQQDMEALFDRRFKQQTSHINDLFSNHLQTTKSALDEHGQKCRTVSGAACGLMFFDRSAHYTDQWFSLAKTTWLFISTEN